MEQEVLQVKKAGDFHYNIFFEKSFEKLSEKLNALNQKRKKNLYCNRQQRCPSVSGRRRKRT